MCTCETALCPFAPHHWRPLSPLPPYPQIYLSSWGETKTRPSLPSRAGRANATVVHSPLSPGFLSGLWRKKKRTLQHSACQAEGDSKILYFTAQPCGIFPLGSGGQLWATAMPFQLQSAGCQRSYRCSLPHCCSCRVEFEIKVRYGVK